MCWNYILATLYWRGQRLTVDDFQYLLKNRDLQTHPETLPDLLANLNIPYRANLLSNWFEKGMGELKELKKKAFEVCMIGDPTYPTAFLALDRPPLILSYFGQPAWLSHKMVSVVGSRNPSFLTRSFVEEQLDHFLTHNKNIALVSGGARGVDQIVHAVCIRKKLATVAFMPSGIFNMYPANFYLWADKIVAAGGAVVSQFAPELPMYKSGFHIRNQLIALMGDYLVLAQAGQKSGSMVTAQHAIKFGKEVFVVPGSPMEPSQRGGLDLLYDGAIPLRDFRDLPGANK